MIPRCPHDIYSPDGDGRPSEYCSGCYPLPLFTAAYIYEDRVMNGGFLSFPPVHSSAIVEFLNDDEEEPDAECPACFAPMKIQDEYDLECIACGFNDL